MKINALITLLFVCIVALPCLAADQEAAPLPAGPRDLGKVLCLGDSITQCRGENGTWRHGLWTRLLEQGYAFDFIGTQRRGDCYRSSTPDFMGEDFDHAHEGHGGWTTGDILRGNEGESDGKLDEWLAQYTPDTVLIHLGGNDLRDARDKPWAIVGIVQEAQRNVREIIRQLQADNPAVTIYLALHIKANGDAIGFANGAIALFNNGLPAIARELSSAQSKVILVDHNTGWTNELLDEDGFHPNAAGNARMAETWFKTIHEGPQEITLQPPIASCVPQCDGKSAAPGWGDLLVFGASIALMATGLPRFP